jgi:hypothetical protein
MKLDQIKICTVVEAKSFRVRHFLIENIDIFVLKMATLGPDVQIFYVPVMLEKLEKALIISRQLRP